LAKEKAYKDKCVTLVLLKEGIYDVDNALIITCPISIHGAGQDKTIIQCKGVYIRGQKEEGKKVGLQDMTVKSRFDGLHTNSGLSFLCERMTFTQCNYNGVSVSNTKGRLINCVITQCQYSAISCGSNALIELEGDQTKIDGNGFCWHLNAFNYSSRIHLLFPLTKESVCTNNDNYGQNYSRGKGTFGSYS
jgi:hypothetical protein